ncbi:MAG: DEAD/DEAH box helicase, partial [Pseudomonadales bacterium]|nr:DEAD/DEAH box helicase [Pseudomonadales bacterium]
IHVNCEVSDEIIIAAIDDLMNWAKLINREQNIPEVILSRKEEADLSIDISVSRRWDDEILGDGVINCRSDHFDYFPAHNVEKSTGMDYFYSENSLSSSIGELQQSNLRGILKEVYGYEDFNPGQIDIIENVIQREDTIGILPTGGGKSLCYQLPGILSSGLTLVVCPIKSLMRDQVKELKEIGVHRSASIDSDTSTSDKEEIIRRVQRGKVRFLFVSPERLQVSNFRDNIKALYTANLLNLIVIDEVHCMSEWGHDFRTSYLTLPNTLDSVAKRTTKLCLTATASKKVLDDIQNEFSIDSDNIKTLSLYERKNLKFSIVECDPISTTEKTVKERLQNHLIDTSKGAIIFTPFVDGNDGAFNLYHSIKALNAET